VADTLERIYSKAAAQHADEIGHHLYQAGAAADGARTAGFLAQAGHNALQLGAFEEVLRLIDSALQLLPADRTRGRAEALAMRGDALWGLGLLEDAKAAWRGAVQRFEELDDAKATGTLHRRIAHLELRGDNGDETDGPAAATEIASTSEVEVGS
jgi:tetratricopeptide (TPR) repeat protein